MRRLYVVGIVVILGLVLMLGGVLLMGNLLGNRPGVDQTTPGETGIVGLPSAEEARQRLGLPSAEDDDDNDGLLNIDEAAWGTDPLNPDTDGDGYLDGEEVAASHDPLRPGPDDLLDGRPRPGVARPGASLFTTELIESFLVNKPEAVGGGDANLTDEYNREYKEEERSPATMSDYAKTYDVTTQLPRPDKDEIPDTVADTPSLIAQYVSLADNSNALANPALYLQAQRNLQVNGDSTAMRGIAAVVRGYRDNLQSTPVPESALLLHTLLLGYTDQLAATFDQVALWNEDPVRSMVATRQLEAIDRFYYPLIHDELERLGAN